MTREEEFEIEALKKLDFTDFETKDKECMQWAYNDGAENFAYYFHQHYEPLLNKIADRTHSKIDFSEKEKRLLCHLRDDLTKIFKEV